MLQWEVGDLLIVRCVVGSVDGCAHYGGLARCIAFCPDRIPTRHFDLVSEKV